MTGENMKLEAMAVTLPEVAGHPNRAPFTGVLTLVDEPSTKPPSGARGHCVILTRGAALAALPSLLGMAVDYVPSWDGHDSRRKCGIITHADVERSRLKVAGYLFAKDFPEVERQMRECLPGAMGMSWELADAHVEDMRAEIWTLTRATFTGAAILLREKAAYRNTSFELAARSCRSIITRPAPGERVHAGTTRHFPEAASVARPARTPGKEETWNHRQAKTWSR
jgi:hypothetical protein